MARLTGPRGMALAVVGAVTAVAGFLFFVDPQKSLSFAPCPFHLLTGFYCPGCGTLRALHALLHGEFLAALSFNPLTILSLPFLAYPLFSQVLVVVRGRGLPAVMWPPWAIRALFVLIVAYWILRNVPVYPFTVLAP